MSPLLRHIGPYVRPECRSSGVRVGPGSGLVEPVCFWNVRDGFSSPWLSMKRTISSRPIARMSFIF